MPPRQGCGCRCICHIHNGKSLRCVNSAGTDMEMCYVCASQMHCKRAPGSLWQWDGRIDAFNNLPGWRKKR